MKYLFCLSLKTYLNGTNSVKLLSVEGLEFWNVEKIKAAFLSLYDLVFSLELKFRNINGFQFDTYFWNRIRIFKGSWISIWIFLYLQKSNFVVHFYEKNVLRFNHLQFVQTRNTLRYLQMYKLHAIKFYQIPFFLSSAF